MCMYAKTRSDHDGWILSEDQRIKSDLKQEIKARERKIRSRRENE